MLKRKEEKLFIGFYNVSVLLTYIGVVSGIIGMYLALNHRVSFSLICLLISGICDTFDGRVARKIKRSDEEKCFGIEIDSLSDMVSFIFLPVLIFFGLGIYEWYNVIIFAMFTLGGVIRLAYFNTKALKNNKDSAVTHYSGLPVTTTCVIFPIVYLLRFVTNFSEFKVIYTLTMLFVSILFTLNFKIKKPKGILIDLFVVFGIVLSIVLFLFGIR